jgi:bacterioferritin
MSANLSDPAGDPVYPFLSGVAEIRRRARQHIQNGAATPSCVADRDTVVRLLNDTLATELVCVLRYRRHYCMAVGSVGAAVKAEFLKHAREEETHADRIAERIVQLGGVPDFDPQSLAARSHSEYADDESLADMVEEDLIAERIAIDSYREIIRYLGENDSTTRRLFESILAVEEEHAGELASMRAELLRRERSAAAGSHCANRHGGELQ